MCLVADKAASCEAYARLKNQVNEEGYAEVYKNVDLVGYTWDNVKVLSPCIPDYVWHPGFHVARNRVLFFKAKREITKGIHAYLGGLQSSFQPRLRLLVKPNDLLGACWLRYPTFMHAAFAKVLVTEEAYAETLNWHQKHKEARYTYHQNLADPYNLHLMQLSVTHKLPQLPSPPPTPLNLPAKEEEEEVELVNA